MVMYLAGNIRFIFRGMGCPFAQIEREIAPCSSVATGSCAGLVGSSSSGDLEADQMGLGNAEVIFFVPQPTNVSALANKNMRLARRF